MKKIKVKIELQLEKKAKLQLIKDCTENIFFECTHCKNKKLGFEFYFNSSNLKRYNTCITCTKAMRESKAIQKIKERGY